ncbi:MAG: TlpA disulfide reductase family protein [Bacteroidota bacterium]
MRLFSARVIGQRLILAIGLLCICAVADAQDFRSLTVAEFLEEYQEKPNDSPILYNFWASWCGPCVKELPYFESLHENEDTEELKVVLVSLDFAENRLLSFLERNQLVSEVIFLTDWSGADEEWIPTIHPDWSGAIPITVLHQATEEPAKAKLDAFDDENDLKTWLSDALEE